MYHIFCNHSLSEPVPLWPTREPFPWSGDDYGLWNHKPVIDPEPGKLGLVQTNCCGLVSTALLGYLSRLICSLRVEFHTAHVQMRFQGGGSSFRAQRTYNYWSTVEEISELTQSLVPDQPDPQITLPVTGTHHWSTKKWHCGSLGVPFNS